MSDARLKLTIEQGATFERLIAYKTGTPPVPVDLTGYTARMQVRATIDAPDVLLELSTINARITLPDPAQGQLLLEVSATDTAAITWTGGVYDLELTSPAGKVTRLLRGTVTVSPEVTRG